MGTMTTEYQARVLSVVRSRKKVRCVVRLRARRKNRAERSEPREREVVQRRCPTCQRFPRRLANRSCLHPLALRRILLLLAAIPLDGIRQLPDLRVYLYNLLLRPRNERHLLLNGIRRNTGMDLLVWDTPSDCRRSPLPLTRQACNP